MHQREGRAGHALRDAKRTSYAAHEKRFAGSEVTGQDNQVPGRQHVGDGDAESSRISPRAQRAEQWACHGTPYAFFPSSAVSSSSSSSGSSDSVAPPLSSPMAAASPMLMARAGFFRACSQSRM